MSRKWFPHAVAAAITLPFAGWIAASDIRGVLSPAAWFLPLLGAYYLGLRIGRELGRTARRHEPRDADSTGRTRFKREHEHGDT